jgi:hypothetical protein
MRIALADSSWRAAVSRSADRFGHRARWMKMDFQSQISRAELTALLTRHRLIAEWQPLHGKTPFNNFLVVARRDAVKESRS